MFLTVHWREYHSNWCWFIHVFYLLLQTNCSYVQKGIEIAIGKVRSEPWHTPQLVAFLFWTTWKHLLAKIEISDCEKHQGFLSPGGSRVMSEWCHSSPHWKIRVFGFEKKISPDLHGPLLMSAAASGQVRFQMSLNKNSLRRLQSVCFFSIVRAYNCLSWCVQTVGSKQAEWFIHKRKETKGWWGESSSLSKQKLNNVRRVAGKSAERQVAGRVSGPGSESGSWSAYR